MYRLTLLLLPLLLLAGCRTRYVPEEVHHYHEAERIVQQADSTHRIDSVVILQRGDTVLIRERTINNNYHHTQQVDRKVDSVPPATVDPEVLQTIIDNEVEHKTAPLKERLRWGGSLLAAMILLIVARRVINYIRHTIQWHKT